MPTCAGSRRGSSTRNWRCRSGNLWTDSYYGIIRCCPFGDKKKTNQLAGIWIMDNNDDAFSRRCYCRRLELGACVGGLQCDLVTRSDRREPK